MSAATTRPARNPTHDLSVRREALRGCPLFHSLTSGELDAILDRSALRGFSRNDVVMRRGDPGTGMVVILQGRMRVSVTSPDGKEISVNVLGPGDTVGEMALLDDAERSADVTAIDDGVLLDIQRRDFLPLLESSPSLCLRLMQSLSARLRDANRSLEEFATLSLAGRLGRLLLRLAGGRREGQELRLDLRLSQKDLATLAGASREKVNRQLRFWKQQGVLADDGGMLAIRKPDILAAAE
jgi:CRP-like cAMP-binding protein